MATIINPGNYTDPATFGAQIQAKVDAGNDIVFKPGRFDIGPNCIKIKNPKTLRGENGAKIVGQNGHLMWQQIAANATTPQSKIAATGIECGIFSITTDGQVEISNLMLEHSPVPNPLRTSLLDRWHGSATIAYFVDNRSVSKLKVANCKMDTAATGGINIQSRNAREPNPTKHDFSIQACVIKALPVTPQVFSEGGGNFCGVVLGNLYDPNTPVDMRDSLFEVSQQCRLDPQGFPAIAMFNYESNSASRFLITDNRIGCDSPAGKATALGVLTGLRTFPNGLLEIRNNHIKLETYYENPMNFVTGNSHGIYAWVMNTDPAISVATLIDNNKIELSHPFVNNAPDPALSANSSVAGINYDDLIGTEAGSTNARAAITNNKISGGSAIPPFWGMRIGRAHEVTVANNRMDALSAAHAQLFVEGFDDQNIAEIENCVIKDNRFGKLNAIPALRDPEAVILCEGGGNELSNNDFTNTNAPGWPTGPGCVKMGAKSNDNRITLERHNLPPWPNQYLDNGQRNVENVVP